MTRENKAWKRRWRDGNIGFHQEEVNPLLLEHWPKLVPDPTSTVLVPLCGKSLDLLWLRGRGHRVVGVELSELAARAFFEENKLNATERRRDSFLVLEHDGIEIWVGDFFALTAAHIGAVNAWYDRAAVVALEPERRSAYAAQVGSLLDTPAQALMLTFDYPMEERSGPPFSVSVDDVKRHFEPLFTVVPLDCIDLTEGNRWELSRVWKPVINLSR